MEIGLMYLCMSTAVITELFGIPIAQEMHNRNVEKTHKIQYDTSEGDAKGELLKTSGIPFRIETPYQNIRGQNNDRPNEKDSQELFSAVTDQLDAHLLDESNGESKRLSEFKYVGNQLREATQDHIIPTGRSTEDLESDRNRYGHDKQQQKRFGANAYRLLFRMLKNRKYHPHQNDNDVAMSNDKQKLQKRYRYRSSCNTTKLTVQTVVEYLTRKTICGKRAPAVRFGLGRR